METRFGNWNVRCLYRAGLLKSVMRKLGDLGINGNIIELLE
jgi:hypothetical protein